MMLPNIIRIKVRSKESRGINLYIPMILIYLLLLPLLVLFIPLWLLVSLFTAGTPKGYMIVKIVPAFYKLLCATRGTEVNVLDKDSEVILKIF